MSVTFTKDAIPVWAMDMGNPDTIDAIQDVMPFGVATIPAAADYDTVAMTVSASNSEEDDLTVDVIVEGGSSRATQILLEWGDGESTLLDTGVSTASHVYADTTPVTIEGSNNAGDSDTVAASPDTL